MRRAHIILVFFALAGPAVFQACTTEEVVGVVVQQVVVQPASATVTLGDSLQLTAVVTDDRGNVLGAAIPNWESSAETVVVVDSAGMVWGLRAGSVDVSASFGSLAGAAQITVTPPPVYGFVVLETSGSTVVSEDGGADELTIVLLNPPTDPVVIDVSSADLGEVAVDSATLTFTASNWSTPRTLQVRGVVDGVVDGPQSTDVTTSVAPGSDPSYEGLPPKIVSVTTTDAEVAGFTVTETGGATRVDEGELVDTLLVALDARPGSDVVLSLESGDMGEVVLDSTTLTFTPATWDSARTVTVVGVDDGEADGDQSTPVTVSIVDGSSDDLWDELSDQVIEVSTVDGALGVRITETDGGTSVDESGTEDTFTVVLTRAPASNVVLGVTITDETEVGSDREAITFTPSDWNDPKGVSVWGVDDASVDGPQVTAVTVEVLPGSDPAWLGQTPQEVLVTTTDDDVAGVEVRETQGSTVVDEGGGNDRIRVELSGEPLSDVVVTAASADTSEVRVGPAALTFTPDNWNQRQFFTVVGVDDLEVDGSTFTEVTLAVDPLSDPAFVGLPSQVVTVENEDDEQARFEVIETGGATIVTEDGSRDTFDVVLLYRPAWAVTIRASSLDEGEVTVSPASITVSRFGDWSAPHTFTVTGVADGVVDGAQLTDVTVSVDGVVDPIYTGLPPEVVSVTTVDTQVPGFTVTETEGVTRVEEAASTDTLVVALDARPESDVVLSLLSDDPGEAVLDSATLTFTPANWESAKTVTVAGPDDGERDGDQFTQVRVGVLAEGSDDLWGGLPDEEIEVQTIDALGLTIVQTGGGTSVEESGTEDPFTVALTRAPTSEVVLGVTVADETEVEVDKQTLTFKPSDWDNPKRVKVKGVDDPTVDGPQVTAVTIEVLPGSDAEWVGLTPEEVLVTTTDDDVAGVEVREAGDILEVDEDGSTERIRVELTGQPLFDVVVTASSADTGEAQVAPATLTFTPDNWDDAQEFTVTGVDDSEVDGSTFTDVTIAVDPLSDLAFAGLPPQIVTVETRDDD